MGKKFGPPCPRLNAFTQRVCGGPLICEDEYGDVSCLWCGYVAVRPHPALLRRQQEADIAQVHDDVQQEQARKALQQCIDLEVGAS